MRAFIFLTFLQEVLDSNLNTYGPINRGDIILENQIPQELLEVLTSRKVILEISIDTAIKLQTAKRKFREKFQTEPNAVIKIERGNKYSYIPFKTPKDAKEFLDVVLYNFKGKGEAVNEISHGFYEVADKQYFLVVNEKNEN